MSEHLEGRTISAWTYRHHGCRCDGCRALASAYQRKSRAARGGALPKVQARALYLAGAWVRANNPDQWDEFMNQAYAHVGVRRRRKGEHGE